MLFAAVANLAFSAPSAVPHLKIHPGFNPGPSFPLPHLAFSQGAEKLRAARFSAARCSVARCSDAGCNDMPSPVQGHAATWQR
jgi:hypothetical protein